MIHFHAAGTPKGEPRHRSRVVQPKGKKPIAMAYPDKTADKWKQAVRVSASHAIPEDWEPITEPCIVELSFSMPRPLYHHVAGKADRELKANAPTWHDKKPDSDNLAKAVLDSLTAWPKGNSPLIFQDDCVVVSLKVEKRYHEEGEATGCSITVKPAPGDE